MPSPPIDELFPERREPAPERVEELFQQAFDLAPEDRASWLQRACVDDGVLYKLVDELLISAAAAVRDPVWSGTAMGLEAQASAPDRAPVIDRYRILDKLGIGGMGVVYRAQRSDGAFQKLVAIKIVPWAAGDDKLIERFGEERSILARLDHPGIARLMDAGTTADGLPYLAMELVNGSPIDEFVAGEKMSWRELVELFRRICDAVSYAHRNLVVHRDLKPSNILVARDAGGVPQPKLLDFGVAKILDDSTAATRTRSLTPAYASPEQISGAAITTASDVYSLGVILYELIAGRRPYRATASVMELAQAIRVEETAAPGGDVDPDLAKIILMALRKEPERRYPSAEQLAGDLQRWLGGYPVSAQPDLASYRVRRFLRRHRIAAGATVVLMLILAIGAGATLREAGVAARRFNDVREMASSSLFELDDAIQDVPGSGAARRLLVRRGVEYLDAIARERSGDAGLTLELADAYARIGRTYASLARQSSGAAAKADWQEGLAVYQKADAAYRVARHAPPESVAEQIRLCREALTQ